MENLSFLERIILGLALLGCIALLAFGSERGGDSAVELYSIVALVAAVPVLIALVYGLLPKDR